MIIALAIVAGVAGVLAVAALAFFCVFTWLWKGYTANREAIVPFFQLGTPVVGAVVAWAALAQARTASHRHREQTNADRKRRITESFAKAIEQLGSDKLEVKLGGIYTLERVALESEREYRSWRR